MPAKPSRQRAGAASLADRSLPAVPAWLPAVAAVVQVTSVAHRVRKNPGRYLRRSRTRAVLAAATTTAAAAAGNAIGARTGLVPATAGRSTGGSGRVTVGAPDSRALAAGLALALVPYVAGRALIGRRTTVSRSRAAALGVTCAVLDAGLRRAGRLGAPVSVTLRPARNAR